MINVLFKGKVYSKKYPYPLFQAIAYIIVGFMLLMALLCGENFSKGLVDIGVSPIWIAIFLILPLFIFVIYKNIGISHSYGRIKDNSYIIVDEKNISFDNNKIRIIDVDIIKLWIHSIKSQNSVVDNNYLEIISKNQKYEMGLIIDSIDNYNDLIEMTNYLKRQGVLIFLNIDKKVKINTTAQHTI